MNRPAGAVAEVRYAVLPSPIGDLLAGATRDGLCLLEFVETPRSDARPASARDRGDGPAQRVLRQLRSELDGYFSGRRRAFEVPLAMRGTPFQIEVWRELVKIPYGMTRSYAEIARRVGRHKAARAVGQANGRNGIVILVPCHRVVGGDGSLGGYSSGLDRKRYLLDLERRHLPR
ncbi:MAG: methylated-DNA--[protein]-cysteine S-methyltransferase [Gammaproteobacteria bacterium]|nr:methylated-DNA--[protein]-cysteine S-methyltransferase [Gammaproteobacteria bacterium]MCG3146528.1 Methylated-DNA--protein-cysteine methyltransferase [Gammaproteobacteria bacterium]